MDQRYKGKLAWVSNRLRALDEIEDKLYQMRELAEKVREGNLSQRNWQL